MKNTSLNEKIFLYFCTNGVYSKVMYKPFQKNMMLFCILCLFGCLGPEPAENLLTGSWKYSSYYTGSWEKIIFNKELTYRLETYNGETYQLSILEGTYRYDARKFILEQRLTGDVAFQYLISGDSLITMNKVYLRQ